MANDATNVVIGAGVLYVAPIGTTLPTLTGAVYPISWPAGWVAAGYTDDGVEINYNPTFKDIEVDEEMAPVKIVLAKEVASISAKLAEATLENLKNAIAASTLVSNTAQTHDIKTFKTGSGTDGEVMVGFQGPASGQGLTRVVIAYRAKSTAAVGLKYQRTDKLVIPVEFRVIADSTQPAGERLFKIVDVLPDLAS